MKWLLLFLAIPAAAQSNYVVEDLDKEGQVQAFKMNIDKKFDVAGGTITGKAYLSTTTISSLSSPLVDITTMTASSSTVTNLTVTASSLFSGVTSTATFSGWIDVGREIVTARVSTIQADLSCPTGKFILGGGCNTNDNTKTIVWSYPAGAGWSCYASAAPVNFDIYAICARIK